MTVPSVTDSRSIFLSIQYVIYSMKPRVKYIVPLFLLLSFISIASLNCYRLSLNNAEDQFKIFSFNPDVEFSYIKRTRRKIYIIENGELLWGRLVNQTVKLSIKDDVFNVEYTTLAPTNNKVVDREESCIPIAGVDADKLSFPTCNSVHEFGFTAEGFIESNIFNKEICPGCISNISNNTSQINFLGEGSWRDAWQLDRGSETLVLKTLRYVRAFDKYATGKHRIDALVMERLTSSDFVADIFGFCGNSVVNEFGFMSGGKLRKQNLTPREKLTHASQAAMAVADLHEINFEEGNQSENGHRPALVHLDIKPDNFIVNKEKIMKVHDFNLSQFLARNVVTGELCSLERNDCGIWRSPEECSYSSHLTEKVDLYALGGVLFELLTKRPAYHYDNERATQAKGVFPTIPKKYLKSQKEEYKVMVEMIKQCFVFEPDIRPSAREVANKLSDVLKS